MQVSLLFKVDTSYNQVTVLYFSCFTTKIRIKQKNQARKREKKAGKRKKRKEGKKKKVNDSFTWLQK